MKIQSLLSGLPTGFLKQLSWQYLATISVVVCGFIHTIIIANILGIEILGILALATGITVICAQFFILNMKDVVIRYISIFLAEEKHSSAHNLLKIGIAVNISAAVAYFILICLISPFLNDLLIKTEDGSTLIRLFSLVPIFQFILSDSILGYIRINNKLNIYASGQFISSVLRLGITYIGLVYFQLGIFFVILTTIASGLLILIILVLTTIRLSKDSRRTPWKETINDKEITIFAPSIKKFVRNNYLTGLLSIPGKELDINLLGFFTTVENVGVYKIAKNFISAIWAITDPIHLVLYPECSKFWVQKNHSGLIKFIKRITGLLLLFSILIATTSGIAVPYFIDIFMDAEASYASTLYLIMVSSIIIWVPLLWIHPILLTAARTDLALKASFIHSVLSVVLYFSFITSLGLIGTAIAYAVNAALISLVQYYLLSKYSILNITDE